LSTYFSPTVTFPLTQIEIGVWIYYAACHLQTLRVLIYKRTDLANYIKVLPHIASTYRRKLLFISLKDYIRSSSTSAKRDREKPLAKQLK
jgi:hypothetical protein